MGSSTLKYKRIYTMPGADTSIPGRVTYLENNEYKVTYYAEISANTGTIIKPTDSTIILDSFMSGVDAVIETIINGKPSGESPLTAGGAYVTVTSFDTDGNYTLSGIPSAYPVALLYIVTIKGEDYQNLNNDFVVTAEPVKEVVQTILEGDTNHAPSSDAIFGSIQNYNILYVENNPRPGGFATIDEALATILTSSPTNYFKVCVGVGEFVKGSQAIPSYVSIVGASIQTTTIIPDGNNHVFELTNPYVELSFMTIYGAPAGFAGIYDNDSGDYTQAHKISFLDCDTNVWLRSITQDNVFYGEYLDYNGAYSYGTRVEATGGFASYANLENYYNLPTGGSVIGNYATGVGASVIILAAGQTSSAGGTALLLEDGAIANITSTDFDGWDNALHLANVGAAPRIVTSGITCLNSVDWDILIEHPAATGTIQGAFDQNKLSNDGVTQSPLPATVGILLQGTTDNSITLNGDINGVFGDYITDVSALIVGGSGMGLLAGGYLSDGGGLDLDITQGLGYLLKSDGTLIKYPFPSQTFAIPDNNQGYVYFNSNLILTFSGSLPSLSENIFLGYVGTRGGAFEFISSTGMQAGNVSNKYAESFISGFGAIYSSGSLISENATAFHLDISGGLYFYSSNKLEPVGGTNITFKQYYNTGGSTFNISSTNVLNNTDYNTGGALTPLTANYYAKHSVYIIGGDMVVGNEQYFVALAQAQYSSLLSAQQATIPLPPSYFTGNIVLIGTIIIQEGAANIIEFIDNRPILGAIPAGVSASADHLSLLNLTTGNAGHTQFMMLNGSTPMAGDLDLGGNNANNGGTYNGVVVETHKTRHNFNGADPLLSAVPATIGTANSEGVSNTQVSRADHVHAHGNQTEPTQHAVATISANGFLESTDKIKLNNTSGTNTGDQTSIVGITGTKAQFDTACTDGNFLFVGDIVSSLKQKSGVAAGGTFAGTPKKVTITFAGAFADANYSVSVIGENNRTWSVESQVAGSFVINANANAAIAGNVFWVATKHGEN